MGESEDTSNTQLSLCGSIHPAIGYRDIRSMTCKKLKIARLVGPETKDAKAD